MSSPFAVLLTGGTGKVAKGIAPFLKQAGYPTVIASRKGTAPSGFTGVKFDWLDDSTYGVPFQAASNIKSVLLVAPPAANPLPPMKAFIELAITKGVKRFVLLSASSFEAGGPAMGQVHQYLIDSKVEFAVLRPTWFMENLSEHDYIRMNVQKGEIYSAAGNGKVPWVSTVDIGAVGYRALTDKASHNTDHVILGPELLSYGDCAQILTEVLGRKITHVNLTLQELENQFITLGLSKDHAKILADLDKEIEQGAEDRLNDVVLEVTGHTPRTFRDYVESNKADWML